MPVVAGPSIEELEVEALLVAAPGAVQLAEIGRLLPGADVQAIIASLSRFWSRRGMNLQVKGGEAVFVPARECVRMLAEAEGRKARRLSQAAVETLSYVAMHQPVSLADIERGRGVKLFKGVMDSLLDAGFVRASSRRTDSGRAMSYVTTDAFLEHFGLTALTDLPTPEELQDLVSPPPGD